MADNEIASLDSAPGQDLNATKLHEVCFAFRAIVLSASDRTRTNIDRK